MASSSIVKDIDDLLRLAEALPTDANQPEQAYPDPPSYSLKYNKKFQKWAKARKAEGQKLGWPATYVRDTYVKFFTDVLDHTHVPSSSVVPLDDPTLLFANAGMNQFKPIFLGTVDPKSPMAKWKRAANSQKCIRAGGKHNDLEDVGKDTYHHTFFEMLGNWSFADYFKKEAVDWSWCLLVEVYGLPPANIYATYFGGEKKAGLESDEETRNLWRQYLPDDKILSAGMKDNFWEMGNTGPCGPCTEIHYDRIGGRDVAHLVNEDSPDVIEIWNNVFMQFNREGPTTLKPLPGKHVDTGMGFERLTSILQDKRSNYDTDIFVPLFDAIKKATKCPRDYTGIVNQPMDVMGTDMAYRVISDHIRTLTFSIRDGAQPGNQGRNFVVRSILRRAIRYGRQFMGPEANVYSEEVPLGFFSSLVPVVVELMGDAFPGLKHKNKMEAVQQCILDEELAFGKTLKRGIRKFNKIAASVKKNGGSQISGEDVFKLWGTYGFPDNLTKLMADEKGMTIDEKGYKAAYEAEQKKSQEAEAGKKAEDAVILTTDALGKIKSKGVAPTDSEPKYEWKETKAKIVAIFDGKNFVDTCDESSGTIGLVFNRTNFYYESGGQLYDTGLCTDGDQNFAISDSQAYGGYVLHTGTVEEGKFSVGQECNLEVDYDRRKKIASNHSMTHVINLALRKTLGVDCDQMGSKVKVNSFTFDFNANALSAKQLSKIQGICQNVIKEDSKVSVKEVAKAEAFAYKGLRAMFAGKYPDRVRMVVVGAKVDDVVANPEAEEKWADSSVELCGGTHLQSMGEAKTFYILSEESVASGLRRITAATAEAANEKQKIGDALEARVKEAVKFTGLALTASLKELGPLVNNVEYPLVQKMALRKMINTMRDNDKKAAKSKQGNVAGDLEAQVTGMIEGYDNSGYIVSILDIGSMNAKKAPKLVKPQIQRIQKECKCAVMLFVPSPNDKKNKLQVMAAIPNKDFKITCNDWLKPVMEVVSGKGGGKGLFAQGSSKKKCDEATLSKAVETAKGLLS